MRPFWELHVDPFIDNQVRELSHGSALLVSAAIQWERDELSEDGEIGISDKLLKDGVRAQLHRLALDEPSDDMQDECEDPEEPAEPAEPAELEATNRSRSPDKLRSFEVARQSGRESRSILIEFRGAETIRLSGQDMGPFVQAVTGDDDHEFWVDVESSALLQLSAHLLQEKYQGNLQAVSAFKSFCESKQIPHKYMTF
jgi:hypothetical protein